MNNRILTSMMFGLALLLATMLTPPVAQASANDSACWGQASAVFARMGKMGEHSREQENPRLGLRNLARMLYADEVIAEDSMAALGTFVAEALGLSIDACMD